MATEPFCCNFINSISTRPFTTELISLHKNTLMQELWMLHRPPNVVYASPQEERDDLKAIMILLEDSKENVPEDSVTLEPGSCSVPQLS